MTFYVLGKARTLNPQIRSLILYPIELQALITFHTPSYNTSHPYTSDTDVTSDWPDKGPRHSLTDKSSICIPSGFKATGSVRITSNTPFGSVKSDVRSTFSDLYTKGNVKSDLSFLICYCCLHLSRCNAKTQFFCITLTLHLTLSLISLWEIKNSLTSNTDLTSHTPWLTNLGFVYDTSDTPKHPRGMSGSERM